MRKPSTMQCTIVRFWVPLLLIVSFSYANSAIATTEVSENEVNTDQKLVNPEVHEEEAKFKGFFHPKPIPIVKPIPKPYPIVKPVPIPVYKPIPKPIPIVKPIPKPVIVKKPIPVPIYKPIPKPIPVVKPIPIPVYKPIPKPIPIVKPIPKPFPKPFPIHKKPFFPPHIPAGEKANP